MSYESRIAEYKEFVKKDAPEQAVWNIYRYDFASHIAFFDKYADRIKKERSGLVGEVFEKMVKIWFTVTKKKLHIVSKDGFTKNSVKYFLNPSYSGQVDFLFEDESCLYNGSGKSGYISPKETISFSDSDIANEWFQSMEAIERAKNAGKKIVGVFATATFVNLENVIKSLKKCFDEYIIICTSNDAGSKYEVNNFYLNQIADGFMHIHTMRTLYGQSQEVFEHYKYNAGVMFNALSSDNIEDVFELYQTQKVLSKKIVDKFINGAKEVCLTAPVRSGKTPISADVVRTIYAGNFRGKVVGFETFHPDSIFKIMEDFGKVFGYENVNIIRINGETMKKVSDLNLKNDKLNIVFFSAQYTVYSDEVKALAFELATIMNFLIFDEAHKGYGSDRQLMFRSYMKNVEYILAMTATPETFSLEGIERVEFTIIDMIQSVINGRSNYAKHPIRVRVCNDVFDEDGKSITINKVSEIASNYQDVVSYFLNVMMSAKNGHDVRKFKKNLRSIKGVTGSPDYLLNTKDFYHPRNLLCVCNNKKELESIYNILMEARKKKDITNVFFDYSTSDSSASGTPYKDVVERMNKFFEKRDDNFRIFFVVKQGLVGTTIKNLEGVIMFCDTESYVFYEQASGRCALPVCVDGEDIHFTFVYDPLKERTIEISESMIRYLTKNSDSSKHNAITRFVRSTMMNLVHQQVVDIDIERFEKTFYKDVLVNSMNVERILKNGYTRFIPASGTFNELMDNDPRVNIELLLKIFQYSGNNNKFARHYINNGIFEKNIIPRYDEKNEEIKKEHEKRAYRSAVLNMLLGTFIIRSVFAVLSLSKKELEEIGDINSLTAKELFANLNDVFNSPYKDSTFFEYIYDYPVFNKEYFKSFMDFVDFFCNEDETKRFYDINILHEEIRNVIKTVAYGNRMEIQNIVMSGNAVAQFGEVFTPIDFIEKNIIPRMIEYFGEDWFSKKSLKIADIACGSGNFFVALKPVLMKYQRKHFSTDEECERHINKNIFYGNDIQKCNIALTEKSVDPNGLVPNNPHFTCSDTLSKDFDFWGNTHFDLIIGNPPYQKYNSNGKGAKKIYKDFVTFGCGHSDVTIQIIKGDWINDTKTNKFKQFMTNGHLVELHNYDNSQLIFPTFSKIGGGCCWFIFDNAYKGTCLFRNYTSSTDYYESTIDFKNKSIRVFKNKFDESICKKVICSDSFTNHLSSTNVFGISDDEKSHNDLITSKQNSDKDIPIKTINGIEYIHPSYIKKNKHLINANKVCVGKASNFNAKSVIPKAFSVNVGIACSYSYLVVTDADMSREEVQNCVEYLRLRPVRQLIKQMKKSQNIPRDVYCLVPWQDFKTPWTEERFYETYGYTQEEIDYVNSEVNLYK